MKICHMTTMILVLAMVLLQVAGQNFESSNIGIREALSQNPNKYLLYRILTYFDEKNKNDFLTFLVTSKYQYEFMAITVLIILIMNYFNGKKKNLLVVKNWLDVNKKIFDNNFAHVGVSPLQDGALLDEESTSIYKFYASGRTNCHFSICTFDLKKRQDLVTMILFNIFWPEKDKVIIDIPLDIQNPPPVVFSLLRKREVKNQHANNPDFKYFCKKLKCEGLTESLVVLGENEETVDYLLDTNAISILNKFEKSVQMIYITDQKSVYNYPLTMRFVLLINEYNYQALEEQSALVKLVFYMLDKLANFKMSPANRQKAEKERQYVDEIKLREKKDKIKEDLQNKKAEKKKEEEARSKMLPPEKLRKKEEKEHKKSLKKSLPRKILKF